MLKRLYIFSVRIARRLAAGAGLLSFLEKRSHNRTARWLRSLFSIYDIDDLIHLDLAWWTFEAMDVVDQFLKETPRARVFEYGSGASTVWMARRGARVTSVDHDQDWVNRLQSRLAQFPDIDLRYVAPYRAAKPEYASDVGDWRGWEFKDYVESIGIGDCEYDLIIVDGRSRASCLLYSMDRLSPRGIIVFDNSRRARYRSAIESSGLEKIVTKGLTASLPYSDETTILKRRYSW